MFLIFKTKILRLSDSKTSTIISNNDIRINGKYMIKILNTYKYSRAI